MLWKVTVGIFVTSFCVCVCVRLKHSLGASTLLLHLQMSAYEDSVADHLAKILDSDQHSVVIASAK